MLFRKCANSQWLRLWLLVGWLPCSIAIFASPKPAKTTKTSFESQLERQDISPKVAAHKLNWVVDMTHCHLCGGYFYQPQDLIDNPTPGPFRTQVTHVTARGPTVFKKDGISHLTGGVRVTQPGRLLTANEALIKRSQQLGTITSITLIGDVHFWQYQRLVLGTRAYIDMLKHTITIEHILYHYGPSTQEVANQSRAYHYNAWGYAQEIHNPSQSVIDLKRATYSTCSPLHQFWRMSLRHLHLDRDRGIGTARHAVMRVKGIPVAYLPYISFPIDNRRKSGFLAPMLSFSDIKKDKTGQGYSFGLPFYWNMAPNYDTTITPFYNIERGFRLDDWTRHLNRFGNFDLKFSFLPHDSAFGDYRRNMIAEFQNDASLVPYVDALRDMHDLRGYVAFNGKQQWSDLWSTDLHINYVSDPYFFRDVSLSESFFDPNQLINQFDTKYNGDHWQVVGLLQAYQTLHRIDQFNLNTYDQYRRLPEFDIGGQYPAVWKGLGLSLGAQIVDFSFSSDFPTANNTLPTPIGWRFHVRPSINYDKVWRGGYINPQVYLDTTSYISQFKQTSQSPARSDFNQTRVMPIIDLDTGLYFDRSFHWGQQAYRQTLEPRLFYLYVPYENQDRFPVYDTQLLPFSLEQLFSVNRFNGVDRLENANQISLGLTSRVMRSDDGSETLKADLGMIYYMANPKVGLPGVTLNNDHVSPLIGNLTYDISSAWSATSQLAWDPEQGKFNNASAGLSFKGDNNQTFSVNYRYVFAEGNDSLGLSNSTEEILTGMSWPLFYHWSAFGYLDYVFNRKRPDLYFAGLQYDSCCWALRFVANRQWTGVNPNSTISNVKNQYSNQFMVQILFKGLSSVGSSAEAGLMSKLPGYQDIFKQST